METQGNAAVGTPQRPQTIGEFRVRLSFNPSNNPIVDDIKRKVADLIDLVSAATGAFGDPRAGAEAMTLFESGAMFAVKMVTTPRAGQTQPHANPGTAGEGAGPVAHAGGAGGLLQGQANG
jgi:hypothetical protein